MIFEEAKATLQALGFTVVEGIMTYDLGQGLTTIPEPFLGIVTTERHKEHCIDRECRAGQAWHFVGTRLALEAMRDDVVRRYFEELKSNP